MNREQALAIIALLESARLRPGMYFPVEKSGFLGFLGGIQAVCLALFGEQNAPNITSEILRQRGWISENSFAPWPEMEIRGFSIAAMIEEVLYIEIETLKRIHNIV
jgi:hypothetical protein